MANASPHQPTHIAIGRITKPHGVNGELKVAVMTDEPDRFGWVKTVYLGRRPPHDLTPYHIAGFRFHHEQLLLRFEEIDQREDADRLRNQLIFVPLEDAIPLEEGEFFVFQLVGMTVVTTDGRLLGTLEEVLQTGANDVFIVRGEAYGEILIPDIEEVVLAIDGQSRQVTVHPMPGLLPD